MYLVLGDDFNMIVSEEVGGLLNYACELNNI